MNQVKRLVSPKEQERRKPKWDAFLKTYDAAIQDWQKRWGRSAALPARFDPALDRYVWLDRKKRRQMEYQIEKREDYLGFWHWAKVIIKRWWRLFILGKDK